MIQIINNYLPKEVFKELQEYSNQDFKILKVGDKEFSTIPTPEFVLPYLKLTGHKIILTFIRSAYRGFDSDLNIHCDHIIQGEKSALASVLYINESEGVTENGTGFWSHEQYGSKAPDDLDNEEFDRLLLEDSNNVRKWRLNDYVSSMPNRIVTYNSQLFHSKLPKEIEEGVRKVLVVFYSKEP